jgi:hypothetical protein
MFEGSVDTYLEHSGKRGMKWGVRNRSIGSGSGSAGGKQAQQKPKMSNKKKAAIIIGSTAAIGVAAYALSKNKKINKISGQTVRNAKYDLARKFGNSGKLSRSTLASQQRSIDMFNNKINPFEGKKINIPR